MKFMRLPLLTSFIIILALLACESKKTGPAQDHPELVEKKSEKNREDKGTDKESDAMILPAQDDASDKEPSPKTEVYNGLPYFCFELDASLAESLSAVWMATPVPGFCPQKHVISEPRGASADIRLIAKCHQVMPKGVLTEFIYTHRFLRYPERIEVTDLARRKSECADSIRDPQAFMIWELIDPYKN